MATATVNLDAAIKAAIEQATKEAREKILAEEMERTRRRLQEILGAATVTLARGLRDYGAEIEIVAKLDRRFQ